MAFSTHLLVVVAGTLDAPELPGHLADRAESGTPLRATVVAPASWRRTEETRERLERLTDELGERGIPAEGVVGDADPACAALDVYDPARHDEILVCTDHLAGPVLIDLPHRLRSATGAHVRTLVVERRDVHGVPLEALRRDRPAWFERLFPVPQDA